MADNLEDFLRQAAQRRQQRAAGQKPQNQPPQQRPPQRPPVRQVERSRQVVEAEIIDLEDEGESVSRRVVAASPVAQPHVNPTVGQNFSPSREIDSADERMARHVQDFLVHPVSNLSNEAVSNKDAIAPEIVPIAPVSEITSSTNAQVRQQFKHPLVAMLRRPETVRAAFVASEIFKTKF